MPGNSVSCSPIQSVGPGERRHTDGRGLDSPWLRRDSRLLTRAADQVRPPGCPSRRPVSGAWPHHPSAWADRHPGCGTAGEDAVASGRRGRSPCGQRGCSGQSDHPRRRSRQRQTCSSPGPGHWQHRRRLTEDFRDSLGQPRRWVVGGTAKDVRRTGAGTEISRAARSGT